MADEKRRGLLARAFCLAGTVVSWGLIWIGVLWAFGALWFDFPLAVLRPWVSAVFGVVVVLAIILVRPRWRAKLGIASGILLVLLWWLTLQPRQYRDWKTEVAVMPRATIDGDIATLYQVRNFEYRSEDDFRPRYETRRVDLRNLCGVDMFLNYWGSPGSPYMAHPIMSYDFSKDGRVCFSIETRPEKGEAYSALGGLYRQFELAYVVADERDVIGVRSNHREGEDVYLYRLNESSVRESFLEYVRVVNNLHESPRWYNAISNNCTTAIRQQRAASHRMPWDYRLLVNGLGDQMLYERKAIDTSLPFSALKARSRINDRAKVAGFNGFLRENPGRIAGDGCGPVMGDGSIRVRNEADPKVRPRKS